jgi:ATP-dependent DNA helicase RecQ
MQYWAYSKFRPLQEEIILSVLGGKDTLALMPTGGGKSLCFQVPAMAMEGVCLVVSPLIALMKDQVEGLRKKGIPALAVVSGMSPNEIDIAFDNCIHGKVKFLYLSPERLSSPLFLERLEKMNICLLAIDESHCISQWGYDFRPSYLKIAEIRQHLNNVPVLALTASATPDIQIDIRKKLEFNTENVFRKSFERKNLSYVVLREDDKLQRMLKVINNVPGTGVIYVRTRKRTKDIAAFLSRHKISAGFYHGGLNSTERSKVQDQWMSGAIRVVVATNAFGMGIDKGNVRFVIHLDLPESLEAYYQEAGRAGRDEQKAYAVLLYNESDKAEMEQRAKTSFPELKKIRQTYQALANYFNLAIGSGQGAGFDFQLTEFCSGYNLPIHETFNALKVLELQGYIELTGAIELQSRIHFIAHRDQLYEFQVKNSVLDQFIKIILRSYEGLFDDYVFIQESQIAKRAEIDIKDVIKHLNHLHELGILNYIPAKDTPLITFLEPRHDSKNLRIDSKNLKERKERFIQRAKAVLDYAAEKSKCRSQMLLAYFGEETWHRCGVCDYCLGRNKTGVSDLEFEQVSNQVETLLQNNTYSLHDLVHHLDHSKEAVNLKVLEWLLDNDKIKYTVGNQLCWNA